MSSTPGVLFFAGVNAGLTAGTFVKSSDAYPAILIPCASNPSIRGLTTNGRPIPPSTTASLGGSRASSKSASPHLGEVGPAVAALAG